MVQLHIKKGDESQFLYDSSVNTTVDECYNSVTMIYNGRLKINRICNDMEQLSKHGTMLPSNIAGLTEEQVEELKLVDEWGEKCLPSGDWTLNKDPVGRRNGKQPDESMQKLIMKAVDEAKAIISKKQVQAGVFLNQKKIQETLDMLQGTVTIVYPMNLPPHDPIRLEFENCEDLTGTQASLEVIDPALAQLWFSGKLLERGKKLSDYLGRNEKTKVVLKISKSGTGPPPKESILTEEEKKLMMLHAFRRQEELKVRV
ncbi:cilia- and flagella-associated protein 298 isoform X3 [Planococcus citri]|uniref:cilia- and flagella-associated protein 298 isoform X3 n=1 Tax=Planococcus citri TaxID=170843 RepID=UPI0031F7C5D8